MRRRLAELSEARRVVANRVGRQLWRADAHHIGFATRCGTGHPWRCPSRSIIALCMSPTGSARTRSIATCLAPSWFARPKGWAYRFGAAQLNLHGPGFIPPRWRGCRSSPATAICASNGTGRSPTPLPISSAAACRSTPGRSSASARKGRGHQRLFPRSRRLAARIHFLSAAKVRGS